MHWTYYTIATYVVGDNYIATQQTSYIIAVDTCDCSSWQPATYLDDGGHREANMAHSEINSLTSGQNGGKLQSIMLDAFSSMKIGKFQ